MYERVDLRLRLSQCFILLTSFPRDPAVVKGSQDWKYVANKTRDESTKAQIKNVHLYPAQLPYSLPQSQEDRSVQTDGEYSYKNNTV